MLDAEKRVLNDTLHIFPRHDGIDYHTVAQLVDRIEAQYLPRWAVALNAGLPSQPERTARSIAAYLLDRGLSGELLFSWFTKKFYRDPAELSLVDVLECAQTDLVARQMIEFTVLVAFQNSPKSASGFPKGWLRSDQLSQWLRGNRFNVTNVRPSGGLVLKIKARDADGAAQLAAERIDHFVARSTVATNEPQALAGHMGAWRGHDISLWTAPSGCSR